MPMDLAVGTMSQLRSAYSLQGCRNAHHQDSVSWRQPRQQELCRTCGWWAMLQQQCSHELAQLTQGISLWYPKAQCTGGDCNYWERMGIMCRKERRDKPLDSEAGVQSSCLECWAAGCRQGNPRSCLTELISFSFPCISLFTSCLAGSVMITAIFPLTCAICAVLDVELSQS